MKFKPLPCANKIAVMGKKKKKGTPPNYSCSQQSLYTVAAVVWANYSANLASFTTFKAKYNAGMATAALAAVAAAKLLPNKQTRTQCQNW